MKKRNNQFIQNYLKYLLFFYSTNFLLLNIYMENQITITAQDLALLRSLVEVASSRGAFKADELSTVGQVYDKLNAFLTLLVEQSEKAKESTGTDSTYTVAKTSPPAKSKGSKND
jgi:hypothetical protein